MTTYRLKIGLGLGAAIAALGLAAAAQAGECPAASVRADAMKMGETQPKNVTDNVLGSVELGKEAPMLDGRKLRIRKLVIQPGGVVPWHGHADRPALIFTVEGAITEYRSNCAVPIEHKAGDVAQEQGGVSHWWRNNTKKPTTLISADIKDDRGEAATKPDHM
jgi:quercetin dioxygenase-like cupin family protein